MYNSNKRLNINSKRKELITGEFFINKFGEEIELMILDCWYMKNTQGHNELYCRCMCKCGKYTTTSFSALKRGHTKSCGCIPKGKPIDLIKEKYISPFGIEPVKFLRIEKRKSIWLWRCPICGKLFEAKYNEVNSGHYKSCGCLHYKSRYIDLVKENYISPFGVKPVKYLRSKNRDSIWLWRCPICGKLFEASAHQVKRGFKTSCGCRVESRGEEICRKLLEEHGFKFIQEKQIKIKNRSRKLRCDFYITHENENWVVEYDGADHYMPVDRGRGMLEAREKFSEVRMRDKLKNNWCKQNNVKIIRIPFWVKFEEITIEDLKPGSRFQVIL